MSSGCDWSVPQVSRALGGRRAGSQTHWHVCSVLRASHRHGGQRGESSFHSMGPVLSLTQWLREGPGCRE